jgi:ribonucleotide monophosphatase NagD (HAD superfamily)
MFLGSRSLMSYARYLGLRLTTQEPDIVLLARDRRFNYAKLMGAANAIRGGAELVVANPDLTHPGIAGRIVPETGSLLQAILACTGPLPYRVIGKPEAELFRRALARCGATSAIVIGDNPATDGAGADRLGLPFFPVEGGVNRALSALIAA